MSVVFAVQWSGVSDDLGCLLARICMPRPPPSGLVFWILALYFFLLAYLVFGFCAEPLPPALVAAREAEVQRKQPKKFLPVPEFR